MGCPSLRLLFSSPPSFFRGEAHLRVPQPRQLSAAAVLPPGSSLRLLAFPIDVHLQFFQNLLSEPNYGYYDGSSIPREAKAQMEDRVRVARQLLISGDSFGGETSCTYTRVNMSNAVHPRRKGIRIIELAVVKFSRTGLLACLLPRISTQSEPSDASYVLEHRSLLRKNKTSQHLFPQRPIILTYD
ncbi:unnamed protein product [Prunus armeniaca]|uniref:Uncharacterized protein n=1 Tax=Prunus armeniaca TaxID=36596 RepID=A0A6J5TIJ0_PRUAR|nr:unnamed protein product [Prunus armeniaca]CAB4293925.1 unnamed protein product [Prunus armeniaca]